jgi:hypothetical protein
MAAVSGLSLPRLRTIALLMFAAACVGTTGWLFWQASRMVRLAAAAPLPAVTIETAHGQRTLTPVARRRTIVVLFRKQCEYCLEELDALEHSLERLHGVSLYLLTLDPAFEARQDTASWPRLASTDTVVWGRVRPEDWARTFGRTTVPALYLFDADGRFVRSYIGETSVDALASE